VRSVKRCGAGVLLVMIAHSRDGAIHFICMTAASVELLRRDRSVYAESRSLCVWTKPTGAESLIGRQHELVAVFRRLRTHINNVELRRAWATAPMCGLYAGMNSSARSATRRLPCIRRKAGRLVATRSSTARSGAESCSSVHGFRHTLIAGTRRPARLRSPSFEPRYVT